MNIKKIIFFSLIMLFIFVILGCSNTMDNEIDSKNETDGDNIADGETDNVGEEPEEITLVLNNLGSAGIDFLEEYFINPVTEEFPHISIEVIQEDQEELIVANDIPDLFFTNTGQFIPHIMDHNLMLDLSEFIDQHNYDLSRFSESIIESINNYSDGGEFYALPLTANREALFYNEELFDRFGVQYPDLSMTWEDIHNLVPQLTHEEDGIHYRGIDFPWSRLIDNNQLSLSILDADTDEGLANSAEWALLFETMSSVFHIPGNEVTEETDAWNASFWAGNLAMMIDFRPPRTEEMSNRYNVVPMPGFTVDSNTANQAFFTHFSISPSSEHQEEAFNVLMHVLTDENLIPMVREGRQIAVDTIDFAQHYGQDNDDLPSELNTGAMFVKDFSPSPRFSRYEYDVRDIMRDAFEQVRLEERDIASVLREADEQLGIRVQELRSQE